ncbi:unnamed protein product [Cunninghamella blakesleeana]
MSQSPNLPQGAEELTKHLLNILPSSNSNSNSNNNNNSDSQNKTTTVPSPQHLPNEEASKQIINSPIVTPIPTPKINKQSPTHSVSIEKEDQDPISSLELDNRQKQSRLISPNEINQLWSQLSKKLDNQQNTTSNTILPLKQQHDVNNNHNHNHNDNSFFLFWFGFLCPLLWIIGSFWPKKPDHHGKMAHRWQMINRAMAIGFCILLVCILIAMGIWYSQTSH